MRTAPLCFTCSRYPSNRFPDSAGLILFATVLFGLFLSLTPPPLACAEHLLLFFGEKGVAALCIWRLT